MDRNLGKAQLVQIPIPRAGRDMSGGLGWALGTPAFTARVTVRSTRSSRATTASMRLSRLSAGPRVRVSGSSAHPKYPWIKHFPALTCTCIPSPGDTVSPPPSEDTPVRTNPETKLARNPALSARSN